MAVIIAAVTLASVAFVAPRSIAIASTTFGEWTGSLALVHDDAFGEVHFTQEITLGPRVSGDDTTYTSTYVANSHWTGSIITHSSHGGDVCDSSGGNCHFVPDLCLVTTTGAASGDAQLFVDITVQQVAGEFHYKISADNLVIVTLPEATTDSCGLLWPNGNYNFVLSLNWSRLAPPLGVHGLVTDNAIQLQGDSTRAQTSDGADFDDGWLISFTLTRTSSEVTPVCSRSVHVVFAVYGLFTKWPSNNPLQPNGCWTWDRPSKKADVDGTAETPSAGWTICNKTADHLPDPKYSTPGTGYWLYDDIHLPPPPPPKISLASQIQLTAREIAACLNYSVPLGRGARDTKGYVYLAWNFGSLYLNTQSLPTVLTGNLNFQIFAELYTSTTSGAYYFDTWKNSPQAAWTAPMGSVGQGDAPTAKAITAKLCAAATPGGYMGLYGSSSTEISIEKMTAIIDAMNSCTTE